MQKTGIIVLGSVAAMLPALAQASETVRLAEPDLAMEGHYTSFKPSRKRFLCLW